MLASQIGWKPYVFRELLCIEDPSFLSLASHTDKWSAVLSNSFHTAEKRIVLILSLESSVDNWNCSSWCCSCPLLLPQVTSSPSFILWQGFHLVFTVQSSILRSLCWADRLGTLHKKHITPRDICWSKSITDGSSCTPCYFKAFFSGGDFCPLYALLYRISCVMPRPVFVTVMNKDHFWQHTLLYISVQLKII